MNENDTLTEKTQDTENGCMTAKTGPSLVTDVQCGQTEQKRDMSDENCDSVSCGEKGTDAEKDATTEKNEEKCRQIIEAILFAAGDPVPLRKLSELLQLPMRMLRTLLSKMEDEWYRNRGIQLLLLEDCCQLVAREDFREPIKKALGIRHGGNLSKSSFEVLAIVAYHQPVTRSYVDEVRGVDSGHLLSSLFDKGLIEVKGRLELPGRPSVWGTTPDFLRVFGLSSIKELPPAEQFLELASDEAVQIALPIDETDKTMLQHSSFDNDHDEDGREEARIAISEEKRMDHSL